MQTFLTNSYLTSSYPHTIIMNDLKVCPALLVALPTFLLFSTILSKSSQNLGLMKESPFAGSNSITSWNFFKISEILTGQISKKIVFFTISNRSCPEINTSNKDFTWTSEDFSTFIWSLRRFFLTIPNSHRLIVSTKGRSPPWRFAPKGH